MTKQEQLKLLQDRLPNIMGSEKFSQAELLKKLNEMQASSAKQARGGKVNDLLSSIYTALADPEVATAYLAPMGATKPEVVARVKSFSEEVKKQLVAPKAPTATTTPATTTPATAPAKTPAKVVSAKVEAPIPAAIRGTGMGTQSVSQRISKLEASGRGKIVLKPDEEVPAGYEMVSTIAGRKVVMPLEKTATGEVIPEPSQESLQKSLATRTGPDYAAMSEVDLTGRARQAQDVITGKTETGNLEQKTGAYSEYRQIQKAIADKKAAAATTATADAATASANKVKAYGQAVDQYQAGVSGAGTDAEFAAAKQAPAVLFKDMNLSERSRATSDMLRKSRAATPVIAAEEETTEEKKKSKLPSARSIFGR